MEPSKWRKCCKTQTYSNGYVNEIKETSQEVWTKVASMETEGWKCGQRRVEENGWHHLGVNEQQMKTRMRANAQRDGHPAEYRWRPLFNAAKFGWRPLLEWTPLPSNRHHQRCGDCLEGKGENYQVCSVQYCVQQLCTVWCTHIWTD